MTTEDELICALQESGEGVTWREFKEMEGPAPSTVQSHFGSWNAGKKAAGLSVTEETSIDSPPDTVDISQDRWEEISGQMRAIYRRRDKSAKLQLESGCEYCGYDDHPAALQWHHTEPENKDGSVSTLIQRVGWDTVKAEIDKCIVLCVNCHRVEEDNTQQRKR